MDTATAIATARRVAKMADKVIKYIKADNDNAYGLTEEVTATIKGADIEFVGDSVEPVMDYTTTDRSLTVEVVGGVRLTAHPFSAEARLWNGPDVIADNQYRSMLASLFHDLIWGHADELARAWGVGKRDVLTWGNGVLYALWMYASADSLRGRIEARVAWHLCEFSAPWYHAFKRLVGLHCLAAALMLAAAGCGTPPDWRVVEVTGTNAVLRAMGKGTQTAQPAQAVPGATEDAQDAPGAGEANDVADRPQAAQREAAEVNADGVEFSALDWCWGGFSGGGAKLVDGVEIADLRVTADGLSYRWARGGCEQLGATSREDYQHTICALFARVGGKWRGGKFDWISTSRTTRDFRNISDGYDGWDREAVGKADRFAFVIVSKDGKRRSNVITATR